MNDFFPIKNAAEEIFESTWQIYHMLLFPLLLKPSSDGIFQRYTHKRTRITRTKEETIAEDLSRFLECKQNKTKLKKK